MTDDLFPSQTATQSPARLRRHILVDIFGALRVADVLDHAMLLRLQRADAEDYDVTVLCSTTIIDLQKREELHAITGWLTDHWVPWKGIWMRDRMDDVRGLTYAELKVAWVNRLDRATVARLYDPDPKMAPLWRREGFVAGTDQLLMADGSLHSSRPVWVPQEALDEPGTAVTVRP